MDRLGFGILLAPFHPAEEDPTLALQRDLELVDHLTRGRAMLGCGPGSPPTNPMMLGLDPAQTRALLPIDLAIIMRLLRGETVSTETPTHTLIDARLLLRPDTQPHLEVVVSAVASPTGPRMAGTHGKGCCRSAQRCPGTGSTRWPTTGTSSRSRPRRTARPSTGRPGGWSG